MPLPEPTTKESESDFIGRCMENDIMVKEYPEEKQRAAVCHAQLEPKGELSNFKEYKTICLSELRGIVDAELGTIEDVSILTEGEAKGHRMMISSKTLESSITLLLGKSLPAYLSHSGAMGDRLLTEAGYFSQFYRDGDQIRARKFTALESFKKYDKEKYDRLFEIAKVAPESFGVSIVFEGTLFWEMNDGTEQTMETGLEAPENARFEYPTVRPLKITSVDFVDTPAANGALFSQIGDKSLNNKEMNTTESKPIAEPTEEQVEFGASPDSASFVHEQEQEKEKKAEAPAPEKKKPVKKKKLAEQDEEDREDEQRGEEEEIAEKDQGPEAEEEGKKAKDEEDEEPSEEDKFEEPDDEYQEKMRAVVEEIGTHIAEVYDGFGKVMERFDELKKMTGDHRVEEKSEDEKELSATDALQAQIDELKKLHKGTAPIKDRETNTAATPKQKKEHLINKYLEANPQDSKMAAIIAVGTTNPELFENN